jgi:hypothetical protein
MAINESITTAFHDIIPSPFLSRDPKLRAKPPILLGHFLPSLMNAT